MSRAWLPRRIQWVIPAFCAALAIVQAFAGAAAAQERDPRNVTVIGGDAHGQRCIAGVMAADSSDRVVEECTRALRYPRLTRQAEAQITINRGVLHLRRHEADAALTDFDAVIDRDDDNAEAHLNRGAALVQLRRHGEAIAAITRAMQLGVREPHKAYFNRGAARESLGDLRGAFEDYSTALEIQPDWGPANAELARFVRTRRDHLATVLSDDPPTP